MWWCTVDPDCSLCLNQKWVLGIVAGNVPWRASVSTELRPPDWSRAGYKQQCSPAPPFGRVLKVPRELSWFFNLLYSIIFSDLLLTSCLISPQLSLRSTCSLYKCVLHCACVRGVSYCHHLALPSVTPVFISAFLLESTTRVTHAGSFFLERWYATKIEF